MIVATAVTVVVLLQKIIILLARRLCQAGSAFSIIESMQINVIRMRDRPRGYKRNMLMLVQ